jgi:hypothetical protein
METTLADFTNFSDSSSDQRPADTALDLAWQTIQSRASASEKALRQDPEELVNFFPVRSMSGHGRTHRAR